MRAERTQIHHQRWYGLGRMLHAVAVRQSVGCATLPRSILRQPLNQFATALTSRTRVPRHSPLSADLKGRLSMARPNEAPDLLHWWNPRKIILQMAILQAAYTLTATTLITFYTLLLANPFRIDYFFRYEYYRSDNVFGLSLSLLSLLTALFTYVLLSTTSPYFYLLLLPLMYPLSSLLRATSWLSYWGWSNKN